MESRFFYINFLLLFFFFYTIQAQTYRIAVIPKGTKKCGYIDLDGKIIVEAKYYNCYPYTSDGTALIIGNGYKNSRLFDLKGNEFTPEEKINVSFEDYLSSDYKPFGGKFEPISYKGGILRMRVNNKWAGLNTKGELSVPANYDLLTDFNNGYAIGRKEDVYYVVNKNGEESTINGYHITYIKHFTEGLAPIEVKGKKWGFVDTTGSVIITPQYIGVGYFSGGLAWARLDDKTIGFLNIKGEWTIEPQYGFVNNFDKESGLARVKRNKSDSKWIYIDTAGKIQEDSFPVDPSDYNNFSDGMAIGKLKNRYGYFNNKGEWVIKPQFKEVGNFINGFATVYKEGKWGLINNKGDWVLQPIYNSLGSVAIID